MRGRVDQQENMWFTQRSEDFVPETHPLRGIKKLADAGLARLSPVFNKAYAKSGRRSVPPERLIKATLLQALFSIRSERQLCEQIFRWFLDLKPDDPVFDPTPFTKNRDRFAEYGFMEKFFNGTVAQAICEDAVSEEHFSVDGTLIESWASMKSFRPKDDDDDQFLHDVEELNMKPHVPTRKGPIKATDQKGEAHRRARRRKRTLGYQLSERKRRLVEKPFGWLKEIAGLRRTRFVGRWKTKLFAQVSAAAYNLLRLTRIRLEAAQA